MSTASPTAGRCAEAKDDAMSDAKEEAAPNTEVEVSAPRAASHTPQALAAGTAPLQTPPQAFAAPQQVYAPPPQAYHGALPPAPPSVPSVPSVPSMPSMPSVPSVPSVAAPPPVVMMVTGHWNPPPVIGVIEMILKSSHRMQHRIMR